MSRGRDRGIKTFVKGSGNKGWEKHNARWLWRVLACLWKVIVKESQLLEEETQALPVSDPVGGLGGCIVRLGSMALDFPAQCLPLLQESGEAQVGETSKAQT